MVSDRQILLVGLLLAAIVSALDAVAGRALQASPALSVVLSLAVAGWVAYRRAAAGFTRLSILDGVVTWAVYVALYALWARLLIGWNSSTPWTPRAETLLGIAAASIVVSFVGRTIGQRRRLSTSETGSA
jgi:hypothetical protein